MEALKEKKIRIIHLDARGVASEVPLKEKRNGPAFLAFFTGADSSRNSVKPLPPLQKEIPLKREPSGSRPDRWSAFRNRMTPQAKAVQIPAQKSPLLPPQIRAEILHDLKTEKPTEKNGLLFSLRAQILLGQVKASAKKFSRDLRETLEDLRSSKKAAKPSEVPPPKAVSKKNPLKNGRLKSEEIYKWVALEEKIIHDYTEEKTVTAKGPEETYAWVALEEKIIHPYAENKEDFSEEPVFLPKAPEKQSVPVFETFSTQTMASPASKKPVPQEAPQKSGMNLVTLGIVGFAVAGIMAGIFAFQWISTQRAFTDEIEKVQSEKKQAERSHAEVQRAMENQLAEVAWLNSQVRDLNSELMRTQDQRDAYKLDLARVTSRYESELSALREDLGGKASVIAVLKAQIRVLSEALDQASGASVAGAASQYFVPPSGSTASSSRGRVSKIEAQKGFLVVDKGSNEGVRFGDSVTISRDGAGLTIGRIDRVYSTMSSVIVPNKNILNTIREGDTVSFI